MVLEETVLGSSILQAAATPVSQPLLGASFFDLIVFLPGGLGFLVAVWVGVRTSLLRRSQVRRPRYP